MRKRNSASPQEMQRHQSQQDEAVAGPWGDMHEAKRQSGLGRSTIAELIRQEKIRSSKIGKRRLIHLRSLLRYIDALAVGPEAPSKEPERERAALQPSEGDPRSPHRENADAELRRFISDSPATDNMR